MSMLPLGTLVMMLDIRLAWTPLDSGPKRACDGEAGVAGREPFPWEGS